MSLGWLISLLLVAQIVPKPMDSNTYTEIHHVNLVHSPCCQDVVFELQGDNHVNYINRGVEQGIDPREWNARLINRQVRFTFIEHKSLFGRKLRTIAKIEFENETMYNAIS